MRAQSTFLTLVGVLAAWLWLPAAPALLGGSASDYNVVWNSPSESPSGSMPLGNGDIAVNAWVEPHGDLVFYIAKTDAWDDNGRLLKVGKIRLGFDPPLVTHGGTFRQTLDLPTATMNVALTNNERETQLSLWVDAHDPAIHVTIVSKVDVRATASIELWRTQPYTLPSIEVSDLNAMVVPGRSGLGQHAPTVVEPDRILKNLAGRIGWCHHNRKSVGPTTTARIQGLDGFPREDPLLHRTFGAVVLADRGRRLDDERLESPPAKSHRFSVYVLTEHPATPSEWLARLEAIIAKAEDRDFAERRRAHEAWWRAFWDRSWIHVTPALAGRSGNPARSKTGLADETFLVSRAYALQRFINAGAGRGRYPIKFNGSLFTVPAAGEPGDADYRRWGPGYWWQNTRLPYFGMCAAGDYDLMRPLMRMYGKDLLPLFTYRTQRYFGHGGAFIPECIYFWGDVFSETYGWTPFEERKDKLQESRWHKWEWVSGLELAWLMLDYYEHTQDETFLREQLLPLSHKVLTFFDQHYRSGPDGKLVMHPAQALETWHDCTNPMPEVAGLHAVTGRLLALPERLTSRRQRAFWRSLQGKLPELPTRQLKGVRMLAPAARFAVKSNIENPELYAVFPFRLVSFDKPNAELGIQALRHRWDKGNGGWRQDDVFMAYLGLADEAREYVAGRARAKDPGSRFPAFWGPNFDWTPDQDHGAVLMRAFQAMLMQTEGRKIFLLPAWPKEWDAEFRLHAPYRTIVEGTLRGGRLIELRTTPSSRRDDVVIVGDQWRKTAN